MNQVSVECAASGVDLAVLRELGGKDVMFGAIDVGTEEVETAGCRGGPAAPGAGACAGGAVVSMHRLRAGSAQPGGLSG